MTLTLVREPSSAGWTFGVLYVDGRFQCHTLEDVVRTVKIQGETAIPAGTYGLTISQSPRFGRRLPFVENVPGFAGVRIHAGNRAKDTEGCILVGRGRDGEAVTQSIVAFAELFATLDRALTKGTVARLRVLSADATFPDGTR